MHVQYFGFLEVPFPVNIANITCLVPTKSVDKTVSGQPVKLLSIGKQITRSKM